jgi:hypothetical protein
MKEKWNMKTFENKQDTQAVVKRIVFLAWQASNVFGSGAFQDRGPQQTEEQVWHAAYNSTDYIRSDNKPGEVYCDYVMGRMMKLHITWKENSITMNDGWRADYQSFCRKYPTPEALFLAAEESMAAPVVK